MTIEKFKTFEYYCQDVQELLFLYAVWPEEVTFDERDETTRHLLKCPECRDGYLKLKQVAPAIRKNPQCLVEYGIFEPSRQRSSGQELTHEEIMQIRFEARLERAILRRKRRERREKIAKIKLMAKPISAIAACLVVGFGLFFAMNQFNKSQSDSSPVVSNQQQNSVKIELISGDTTELIATGHLITASNELKTLRINNNRQMILNVGTELSIEPYNLGCVVKLDKGQIYTEVEHDGRPFMVETSHGRAVITGTTLNIKSDNNKMDLAVIEGSVQFESEKGSVDVVGGYQSSITGVMKPTMPVACNVISVSKWAKEQKNNKAIQVSVPDVYFTKMLDMPVDFIPYRDLEKINFEVWIDEHRQWFEREFPWTKRLQDLLAQNGIKVDTIDLLIESGDLWRFAWPEHSQSRILVEDQEVIRKVADQYGVEFDKLISGGALVQTEHGSSIEALGRWLNAIDKNNVTIDSIHAATFLINTRSLAWYAVNGNHVQAQEKQQVLSSLTKQVKYTSDLLGVLNQILLADKNESICSVAQYGEYTKKIKGGISLIMEIEKKQQKCAYRNGI